MSDGQSDGEEPGQDAEMETRLRSELDEALLALDQVAHQDPEEALAMFESLPEPVQALADFQVLLARAHQGLGQLEASRELLEAAVQRDADLADAHHLLGDVLEDLNDSELANKHFLKARELDLAAFQAVPDKDRTEFEARVLATLSSLSDDLAEIARVTSEVLPTEAAVLRGMDPRALAHFGQGQLIAYSANLYAELGDLPADELEEQLRIALLLDQSEALGLDEARQLKLGLVDES